MFQVAEDIEPSLIIIEICWIQIGHPNAYRGNAGEGAAAGARGIYDSCCSKKGWSNCF
jgi:hypothetical protein